MSDATGVGKRLEEFRKQHVRASARGMATLLTSAGYDCTHNQVLRYERGTPPPATFISALTRAAGLSAEWLINGIGPMYVAKKRTGTAVGIKQSAHVLRQLADMLDTAADRELREDTEDFTRTYDLGAVTLSVEWRAPEG